jgi:transposase
VQKRSNGDWPACFDLLPITCGEPERDHVFLRELASPHRLTPTPEGESYAEFIERWGTALKGAEDYVSQFPQKTLVLVIAEVGAGAATFPSAKQLSSWVGACPGDEESAEVSKSHRSPQGNRHMRRILNQAANAAAKSKGTVFEILYRRLISRLGHNQTIRAIAHWLCRLIWIILHRGVRYEGRGPSVSAKSRRRRTNRMIRELRSLGYRVESLVSTV